MSTVNFAIGKPPKSGGAIGAAIDAVSAAVTGQPLNGTVNGKRGFQKGNKYGANRNHGVLTAQKAHTAAKNAATKAIRAHTRKPSPASLKAVQQATRTAAAAHRELQAAKVEHAGAKAVPVKAAPAPQPVATPAAPKPAAKAPEPAPTLGSGRAAVAHDRLEALKRGVTDGTHTDNEAINTHVDRLARGTNKAELFDAASRAGISHGATTKVDLVNHLKNHVLDHKQAHDDAQLAAARPRVEPKPEPAQAPSLPADHPLHAQLDTLMKASGAKTPEEFVAHLKHAAALHAQQTAAPTPTPAPRPARTRATPQRRPAPPPEAAPAPLPDHLHGHVAAIRASRDGERTLHHPSIDALAKLPKADVHAVAKEVLGHGSVGRSDSRAAVIKELHRRINGDQATRDRVQGILDQGTAREQRGPAGAPRAEATKPTLKDHVDAKGTHTPTGNPPKDQRPPKLHVPKPEDNDRKNHVTAAKYLDKIFGGKDSHERALSLTGATGDDATASLIAPSFLHAHATVKVDSPDYTMQRAFYVTASGKRVISNDIFKVNPAAQGKGLGSKVFARQVEEARKAGFDQIRTEAAGEASNPKWNGYYTWARMGYDAPLPKEFRQSLPPEHKDATRISDLMMTPAGRDYWKAKGSTTKMTFDLNPDSVSSKIHAAYLAERASRPVGMADDADPKPGDDGGDNDQRREPDFTEEELAAADRAWDRLHAEGNR